MSAAAAFVPVPARPASPPAALRARPPVALLPTPDARSLIEAIEQAAATGHTLELLDERDGAPDDAELVRGWAGLLDEAARVATALRARGVGAGERVVVVLPTSFEFVSTFFGVLLAGGVPVPTAPPALLDKIEGYVERLRQVVRHSGARLLVTDERVRPLLGRVALANRVPIVDFAALDVGAAEPLAPALRARPRPEDPCFIQYTSGSTGAPKGVLLSHRNLLHNITAIGGALGLRTDDSGVSWLPLQHDMGLIGTLLTCLVWRVPLLLMSPLAFVQEPSRWLRALSRRRATISPAPNFAYALCVRRVDDEALAGLDLSSWRVALNGAEPVNLRTLVDFERRFSAVGFRRDAILPVYGLAEATLAVAFPPVGAPLRVEGIARDALAAGPGAIACPGQGRSALTLVACGRAIGDLELSVRREDGQPAADREIGRVVVRGASVMEGYFQDRDASAETIDPAGYLDTGDLGFLSDGDLLITGRAKDVLIIRGRNYHAEDLERAAERVAGIRGGTAIAFGHYDERAGRDRVVVVAETRLRKEAEQGALREAVREALAGFVGLTPDEVVLLGPGRLPKTTSGKKRRQECRRLYLDRALDRDAAPLRLRLLWLMASSRAAYALGGALARARRLGGAEAHPGVAAS